MRGVAVDCTNKPPSALQVRHAGLDSIRIEMRNLASFYQYTQKVQGKLNQTWLVGPSTGDVETILTRAQPMPSLVIIGNEPDGAPGDSSWAMTPEEYIWLWNSTAPLLKEWSNSCMLATAGMYSKDYLHSVLPKLNPSPNLVNMHYPAGIDQFNEFSQDYPCIVGEWCWRNASKREMYDWVVHFLDYYAWDWFWFCWADYMVPNMGLVTAAGNKTKAYYRLKEAVAEL